jgi:hypothetical protein
MGPTALEFFTKRPETFRPRVQDVVDWSRQFLENNNLAEPDPLSESLQTVRDKILNDKVKL